MRSWNWSPTERQVRASSVGGRFVREQSCRMFDTNFAARDKLTRQIRKRATRWGRQNTIQMLLSCGGMHHASRIIRSANCCGAADASQATRHAPNCSRSLRLLQELFSFKTSWHTSSTLNIPHLASTYLQN